MPFIKRFHAHNLPYTLPLDNGQYYDVNEPAAVPVPIVGSSSRGRCIGEPDPEIEEMESLVSESLHKVAAVLRFEPTSRTPGMNAATVRDAFTQRKRRCLALAAANIGQAEEDIEGLHRQGVRGHKFTFESERVKKSRHMHR